MNILITPAWKPTESEIKKLKEKHHLFFIEDGRVPLSQLKTDFNPEDIEGVICNFFFMYNDPDIFPNLKFVQLTSVGFDRVPVEKLHAKGVKLFNAGSVYAIPMAEWALSRILEVYKQNRLYNSQQIECKWEKCREIKELSGSTAAIIGFGNVGKNIAIRLKAFGVSIHAVDIIEDNSGISDKWSHINELCNVVSDSDIIILALPLTDKTYHLFGEDVFSSMKNNALLVNSARGALIDEQALINALNNGQPAAFVSDTFETEPLPADNPLWHMPQVYITPHSSFIGNNNNNRLSELILNNING